MRISSGISEIGFNYGSGNRVVSEKFYVWPMYNAGRVEQIHSVAKRTEFNAMYSKPTAEDRQRVFSMYCDNSSFEYTSRGSRERADSAVPGSLFDAIA